MKVWRAGLSVLLIAALTASLAYVSASGDSAKEEYSARRTEASTQNWSSRALLEGGNHLKGLGEPRLLRVGESVSLTAETDSFEGYLVIEYKPQNAKPSDCLMNLTADGKEYVCSLPFLWTDESDEYSKDSYGNEIYPNQMCLEEYTVNALEDYQASERGNLTLSLEPGEHTFVITAESQDILISDAALAFSPPLLSYEEYRSDVSSGEKGSGIFTAEAEKYAVKSDSVIRSSSVSNPVLVPYDTYQKKINVIDGGTWDTAGQKIAWEIEVKKSGFYQLGMRYSLGNNGGKPSYRSVEIDGAVPFAEWKEEAFFPTGNGYKNHVMTDADGKAREIYLTKGIHTVAMRVEMGPLNEPYTEIKELMSQISEMGAMLQKLTAGTSDENRTWDMDEYMPGTIEKLNEYAGKTEEIYEKLKVLSGGKPAYASGLIYAAESLKKLAANSEQLPNRTELLSIGDNSVSKYLGTVLTALISHPLTLDRVYVYAETELPDAAVPFYRSIAESAKAFFHSFIAGSGDSDYAASYEKNGEELQVWINRPIQYVQVLQQKLDETYNAEHKTAIRLSIMPNEQKLILANASGANPDVALGVAYSTPFNFAIRGGAKNLLDYDDFLSTYAKEYNLEALVPLCFADGVYGAVETQDFYVMFYRKDTLAALGLEVPDTWDDVRKMMPELLRYSMNFCVPVAASGGTKGFNVTAPFLYQNGGKLYKDGGTELDIESRESLKGFTEMTELFNIYGAQQTVADFYNSFRYNRTPLGISTFSTYIQLQISAPEIAGLWGIAPSPGVLQPDGTILRYQMADSTAAMIFENTDKEEEAWSFLKWWLSSETQLSYANDLQTSFGSEFRWNTANLEAFKELPYPEKDRDVILEQWSWQKETVLHPSNYMTERELSNAWINVVVNGDSITEAIEKAMLQADREILRKMEEFGYCDKNGNVLKEYKQLTVDDLREMLKQGKADN